MNDLLKLIDQLTRRIERLEHDESARYRGTSTLNFTTTTLPNEGDYGFQTTDDELQMNCDGTILAVAMAAL